MKKYMTKELSKPSVEIVEVEKETDKSVWINGRRNSKRSSYENYFDSLLEAKNYLYKRQESRIRLAEAQIKAAQERISIIDLINIIGLTNNKGPEGP